MATQFFIDTAQTRLSEDSLSTLCTGLDWDPASSTGIYVDGVTNTAMLMPALGQSGWTTSSSGVFAKWDRSDFTLSDSANWEDNNFDSGGPFMHYAASGGNSGGIGGVTTSVIAANQPLVLEWFNPGASPNAGGVFECGWNTTQSGVTGPSLRFYANGKVEVWLNDQMQGTYSTSGKSQKYFEPQTGQVQPDAPVSQYVAFMLIPCRGRELLVLGSTGGGFSHIFATIAEGQTDPVITPNTNFWFYVPPTTEANVRLSPLQFGPTGTLVGTRSFWRYELPSGATVTTQVYQDPNQPQATGTYVDGVNPSSPYANNTNGVRISVAMAGGPSASSFVYAARAYTQPFTEQTFNASVDILPHASVLQLDFADNISACGGHISLMGFDSLASAGIPNISTTTHRPGQLFVDSTQILEAVLMRPKWTDAALADINIDVELDLKDIWQLAEDYIFSDPVPLDGLALDDAYNLLASMAGLSSNVSSSYHSFLLPEAGTASGGRHNVSVKPGDKLSGWLDRLHKTYAGTDYHGISGSGVLEMLTLADLPSAPITTLYETMDLATANGVPTSLLPYSVFRSYSEQVLEPEANDIYVTGMDFRSQRPIVVHKRDVNSANPTTAPGARPANWLGGLRKYGWVDPTITTLAAAEYCANLLYNRLTPERTIGEFECEYIVGSSRKELVKLVFNDGSNSTGRIKSMNLQFVNEDSNFTIWRPCRYTIQMGGDPSSTYTNSTSLHGISAEWKTRAVSKTSLWDQLNQAFLHRPFIGVSTG